MPHAAAHTFVPQFGQTDSSNSATATATATKHLLARLGRAALATDTLYATCLSFSLSLSLVALQMGTACHNKKPHKLPQSSQIQRPNEPFLLLLLLLLVNIMQKGSTCQCALYTPLISGQLCSRTKGRPLLDRKCM